MLQTDQSDAHPLVHAVRYGSTLCMAWPDYSREYPPPLYKLCKSTKLAYAQHEPKPLNGEPMPSNGELKPLNGEPKEGNHIKEQ